jgi:hypothetical protein
LSKENSTNFFKKKSQENWGKFLVLLESPWWVQYPEASVHTWEQ